MDYHICFKTAGIKEEGVTMRVGAYNQISQIYGTSKISKGYNTGAIGATSTLDKVSFSNVGKDMQVAKNALKNVPDIREDKVQELSAKIANGTYEVSPESFADKLVAAFAAKSI